MTSAQDFGAAVAREIRRHNASDQAAALARFFAQLDMRETGTVTIAHASDSTGDAANEYFELAWKGRLAALWPERPARVCRWWTGGNGGLGSYGAWETWQAGTYQQCIYSDNFPVDAAPVIGAVTPAIGSMYSQYAPHAASWSIVGGKLTQVSSTGTRWQIEQSLPGGRLTSDWRFTGKVMVPSGATSTYETEIFLAATNTAIRVGLLITAAGVLTLQKRFDSVTTTLATFATGTIVLDEEATFEVTLSGDTLTGTVNGVTETATLAAGEAATVSTSDCRVILRSQVNGATFDNLAVTTPAATPAGQVSVYNGGAAGQTPQYQRNKLATMYPVRPDLFVINHGHNYQTAGDITGFLALMQALVDDLHNLYPGDPIPVVVTSQNPQFGTGSEADHLAKMQALKTYALAKGWGYIPTYEAFAARPDGGASLLQDTVHPGIDTGRLVQAAVAEDWITSQSMR